MFSMELFSGVIPTDDIENVAAIVEQDLLNAIPFGNLYNHDEQDNGGSEGNLVSLRVISKGLLSTLQGRSKENDHFTTIWHNLLEVWISSLNLGVHKDHRIMLLRHLTRVAFEVFMSSNAIGRLSTPLIEVYHDSIRTTDLADLSTATRLNDRDRYAGGATSFDSSKSIRGSARDGDLLSSQYSSQPTSSQSNSQRSTRDRKDTDQQYSPFEVLINLATIDDTGPLSVPLTRIVDTWVVGQNPVEHDWDTERLLGSVETPAAPPPRRKHLSIPSALPIRSQPRSQLLSQSQSRFQPQTQSQSQTSGQAQSSQTQLQSQPQAQSQSQSKIEASQSTSIPERAKASKTLKAHKPRVPGFN